MPKPQDEGQGGAGQAGDRQDGPKQKKPGKHNADRNKLRAYLKAHGHKASRVDAEITAAAVASADGLLAAVCRLHGMSDQRLADLMG